MTENLYLPGLAPDGGPRTLIDLPGFWGSHSSDQSRGGPGDAYLPELQRMNTDRHGLSAIVQLDQTDVSDPNHPVVVRRIITHNVVTDIGAQNLLKALYNANQTIGQFLILDTNAAAAQLNGALTANAAAAASLTVVGGGNPTAATGNKASNFKNNATNTITGIPVLITTTGTVTTPANIYVEFSGGGIPQAPTVIQGGSYTGSLTAALQTTAAGVSNVLGAVTGTSPITSIALTTAGSGYTLTTQNNLATGGGPDPTTGGGIVVSYGTAAADYCSGETGASSTNTSIVLLNSVTWAHAHASGDWVVALPQTGDGATAGALPGTAIIYNSGSSTNGATATAAPATVSGTGQGSRQAVWSSLIFTTSSTAGSYNNLWIANANTVAGNTAAANFYNHLSFAPLTLNASNQITVTYTLKI